MASQRADNGFLRYTRAADRSLRRGIYPDVRSKYFSIPKIGYIQKRRLPVRGASGITEKPESNLISLLSGLLVIQNSYLFPCESSTPSVSSTHRMIVFCYQNHYVNNEITTHSYFKYITYIWQGLASSQRSGNTSNSLKPQLM